MMLVATMMAVSLNRIDTVGTKRIRTRLVTQPSVGGELTAKSGGGFPLCLWASNVPVVRSVTTVETEVISGGTSLPHAAIDDTVVAGRCRVATAGFLWSAWLLGIRGSLLGGDGLLGRLRRGATEALAVHRLHRAQALVGELGLQPLEHGQQIGGVFEHAAKGVGL